MSVLTKDDKKASKAADKASKRTLKRRAKNAAVATKSRKSKKSNKPRKQTLVKFKYQALNDKGKKVTGSEKAVSAGALHLGLVERGMQPLDVRRKKNPLKFEITKKKVPREEVMNYSRQMAVFMKAGIPIMEALEVIVDETQGKMMKEILYDMIDSLRNGDTFATAAKAHPEAFPNYYFELALTCPSP